MRIQSLNQALCKVRVTSESSNFNDLVGFLEGDHFEEINFWDCMGLFIFCNFTCNTGLQCLLNLLFQEKSFNAFAGNTR